jgi:Undecaprenyl-phosphate glucose phosphotransferase
MDLCSDPGHMRPAGKKRTILDVLPVHVNLLFFGDIFAGILCGHLATLIYFVGIFGKAPGFTAAGPLWREMILGSLISALVLRDSRMVDARRLLEPGTLTSVMFQRGVTAIAILLSVGLATRALDDVARLWVSGWVTLFAGWIAASRWLILRYLRGLSARGGLREAVAVVGAPDVAEQLAARLAADTDIVAISDDLDDADELAAGISLGELQDLVSLGAIDTIVLAVAPGDFADCAPFLEQLKAVPVQLTVCIESLDSAATSRSLRMLGGVPMAVVADRPLQRWDLLIKGLIDKIGAVLLLIMTSPFMLAAAVAIVWESPGPMIFRQTRSGWGGRTFTVFKFRTMRDEPSAGGPRQTERNDPRCTRVGAFLRQTSLDELPQLWNVLRGDMSLVGPRPHAEFLHETHRTDCQIIADYALRQRVKPGLTGWAQIHGLRGAVRTSEQMRRRVKFDLYYIDHWSVWLDLQILVRTPLCVFSAENAY